MTEFNSSMSAADFFEKVVPALAAAKKAGLTDEQKAVSHTMAVVLTGADGGEWSLASSDGDITVSKGVADGANPVVILAENHWREVMTGDRAALGGASDFTNLDTSALKPEILARLEPIAGTLKVVVEDEDEGDMEVVIKFGANAPDEPGTTISTTADIAKQIQSGAINPQMAFMQGGVKIAGDMNLAMQVATLQM